MQENNELPTYSPEEVAQLIAMTEDLQTENEQQREELRKLHRQQQTALSDNQRLSAELQAAVRDLQKLKVQNRNLQSQLQQMEQTNSQTQQQSLELRTALSKIQTLTEKLSEQQRQIQTLLSDNQGLQSQVQQLTAKNEKLNDSDRQLKQAAELKLQSEQKEKLLKEREKQTEVRVSDARREAATAISEANERERAAKRAEEAAERIKREQEALIRNKSYELYELFKERYSSLAVAVILYAAAVTLGLVAASERVRTDAVSFCKAIASIFKSCFGVVSHLIMAAASVGSGIEQPVVSAIVTYLLGGIVALLCIALILAAIGGVGWLVYHVYREYCWDDISPFVGLVSVAAAVSFAPIIPLNIYLLLILSQIAYMIIRWLLGIEAFQKLLEWWSGLETNEKQGNVLIAVVIIIAVIVVHNWIKG